MVCKHPSHQIKIQQMNLHCNTNKAKISPNLNQIKKNRIRIVSHKRKI